MYSFFLSDGTEADAGQLNFTECGSFTLEEELVTEQCEPVLTNDVELKKRILERLPEETASSGAENPSLSSVAEGELSLDEFVGSLSDDELEALTRGHGMMGSSLGVAGNAGSFGGIIPSLQKKGVLPLITADGPSGLRLRRYCSLLPSGTALACSWNTGLTESLYSKISDEMGHYGVDILLAPGMNIHRNPLGGRNFEYFSEDPLLTGKMAAAVIRGIQSVAHAACPKHFACNNQETKRNVHDSRVSERALREIYLRCFEIAVKESHPLTIMTSYNKINGVWSHYNYDLVTTVLRKEWGYEGTVITAWWMQKSKSPEVPLLRNNAYRV
ncbi:MAG: glycoside hydrolase family 3 protein, partial [Firmicutes bacterium]|nr:glycoside hydrolase family 3 protein [Bacillota bacterium]